MKPQLFKLLGYLQIFIGMGAIAGGLPMILSPEGSAEGLSLELLQGTPFENYLIPGILLFSVNGLGSLLASYFSLKLKIEAGIFGIILGIGLIVWIVSQFIILGYASWLQPFYLALGIVESVLGIRIYKMVKQ